MPNHLHAIIILKNEDKIIDDDIHDKNLDINDNVQTHGRASLPISLHDLPIIDISPSLHRLPKSISSFIAGFKSAVNSKIDDFIDKNKLEIPFFQPNYHDHIIRDDGSFHRIKQYIISNPQKWDTDLFQNPTEEE